MLQADRRDFLKLAGVAGVTFTAGLFPGRKAAAQAAGDFHFVQFSDTHWGYKGKANPDAEHTLEKAIVTVNGLARQPDFIVFTGDLTHTTEDPKERRARMKRVREIIGDLKVKDVRFLPGENDAALGDEQLAWLAADLKQRKTDDRIVVLTHRPLFDLLPSWDWATADGAKAIELLMPYQNVVVFYGHIHQENHHMTGHIAHHAAKSLIFPQPTPGPNPPARRPPPPPFDASLKPLGTRDITMGKTATFVELPVTKA